MRIVLDKVSKFYFDKPILKNISIEINCGNIWGISGENGGGKSTLVKMIAGLVRPTSGKIYYFDAENNPIDVEKLYARLSWYGPYIEPPLALSVTDFVKSYFKFKRPTVSLEELYDKLELAQVAKLKLSRLSTGTLQRLMAGLALFSEGEILLLDEPTAFLDDARAERIRRYILDHQNGRTVVVASNSVADLNPIQYRYEVDNDKK